MPSLDLRGKRALVAGVADDVGFGFAIAKTFVEAGATVTLGIWPPAMKIFETMLRRGKLDSSRQLAGGGTLEFERLFPLDAAYDTYDDAPSEIQGNKRYAERGDFSIQGLADRHQSDFGDKPLDIVVHSLANGPEVARPLLETTREGYLNALSVSAYSKVSMVKRFAPLMRDGGNFLSLTYIASDRVIPRYGGGMSSAKAALESDTRTLAFEAGRRWGLRVNTISAGPYASRAASVTGAIARIVDYYEKNAPIPTRITPQDVANTALFLGSPLAGGITGTTVFVDNGHHAMGKGLGDGDLDWVFGKGDSES